jgi:hypothetical protein
MIHTKHKCPRYGNGEIKKNEIKKTKAIYLIREPEHMNTNIFKLGTVDHFIVESYEDPDEEGPEIMFVCQVTIDAEMYYKRKFKELFIHRTDIGRKYFEGDERKMLNILGSYRINFR